MKNISRLLFLAITTISLFAACDKKQDLVSFSDGKAVVLSSSSIAIAPAPSDSDNVAVNFTWTNPGYASDSSLNKYILQIDSSGRNFAHPYEKTIIGLRDTSMLSRELNAIALNLGFVFNVASDLDVRVISSYSNNNEQYASNTVKINFTPYKVPPKVALPESGKLFLVGDASQGGWSNPVSVPSQEFARLDETTFAGVFNLIGGKHYLALPVNGSWDHKFNISDAGLPAEGGDFGYDQPKDFNGPATDGWYLIILNFQTGKYSVTPYTGGAVPDNLYMVGSATPGTWGNPVPTPSQQFTRLNSSVFELSVSLTGGGEYLLLPVNGSWDAKFGTVCGSNSCNDPAGDSFKAGGDNVKGPAASGTYKVTVNFATNKFTVQ